jgi:hypothetical protein
MTDKDVREQQQTLFHRGFQPFLQCRFTQRVIPIASILIAFF